MSSWLAPAKLNLFLHVVGQRDDGLHELQTLFQLLDYGDTLDFDARRDGVIRRLGAPQLPGDDLSVRAARALQAASGTTLGADIHLTKRIPVGAGLGGGSSDAATVLVALNRIWNTGLSRAELTQLGLALGADVPLFVSGCSAWGEGVGERLLPTILPEQQYCVIWPQVSVSTGIIFADRELTRNSSRIRIPGPFEGDRRNDLEPVARRQFPEVGQCLDWLGKFGPARMSGSGSAAFVAVVDNHAGQQILDQLPAAYSGLVARGINQNPAFADESDGV